MDFLNDKNDINGLIFKLPAGVRLGRSFSNVSRFSLDAKHEVLISGGQNLTFRKNVNNILVNFAPGDLMIMSDWVATLEFAGNVRFDFFPPVSAAGVQLAVNSDDDPCTFDGWLGVSPQKGDPELLVKKGKTSRLRDGSAIFVGARCTSKQNKIKWIALDVDVDNDTNQTFSRFMINQLKVEL